MHSCWRLAFRESCRTSGSVRRGRYRNCPREQAGRLLVGDAGSGFAGLGSGLAIVSSSCTSDPPLSYVKRIRIKSWEISIFRWVPAITSLNSHEPARRVVRMGGEAGFDPSGSVPAVRKLHDRLMVRRRRARGVLAVPPVQRQQRTRQPDILGCNRPTLDPDRLGRPADALGAGNTGAKLDAVIGEAAQVE